MNFEKSRKWLLIFEIRIRLNKKYFWIFIYFFYYFKIKLKKLIKKGLIGKKTNLVFIKIEKKWGHLSKKQIVIKKTQNTKKKSKNWMRGHQVTCVHESIGEWEHMGPTMSCYNFDFMRIWCGIIHHPTWAFPWWTDLILPRRWEEFLNAWDAMLHQKKMLLFTC